MAVLAFFIALTEKYTWEQVVKRGRICADSQNKFERVQSSMVGKAWGKS